MEKNELLAFRQHPILPITLEVREDTDAPPHEDMQFSLTLTFRNTSVTKNGVVAKDAEEAAENAAAGGLGFNQVAPQVWDVIPDTLPWSARLKRAMIHLVSLAPSWETLDDWGMTTGTFPLKWKCLRADRLDVPTLEDLEQGDFLLPDEDPTYTEEQVRYVRAYHIVQSVLDFDWATADDQTLRRHPFWLSLEPEDELPSLLDQPDPLDPPDQEPDPLLVNEGESISIIGAINRLFRENTYGPGDPVNRVMAIDGSGMMVGEFMEKLGYTQRDVSDGKMTWTEYHKPGEKKALLGHRSVYQMEDSEQATFYWCKVSDPL